MSRCGARIFSTAQEYGTVHGEEEMMTEILERG